MTDLPTPVDHECLICFLYRVGSDHPCKQSLRFLKHYRDLVAPRATALERKVQLLGGYCDCEVLMNAVRPASAETARLLDAGKDIVCHGVRRGSIQPCDQWLMRRGVQWGGGQFRRKSA
ncbi:DUF2695 domain-containing protein [Glutamicibacter sp. MNS18]|uniref:DUF2695 domain-containing protein n=1 Tax=Glutamicibacter sp. MNS18 TaxID=2989817 RepID=UPI0022362F1B|nr:DUF2695 domain-containing protein [Glutamicibacter sp. MNS18]MCW4465504.1 DUF2695 domain-containing protein [Glutamicibacter sp. MNS18]